MVVWSDDVQQDLRCFTDGVGWFGMALMVNSWICGLWKMDSNIVWDRAESVQQDISNVHFFHDRFTFWVIRDYSQRAKSLSERQ